MTTGTIGQAIAVAVAELRIARRMVRTWIFAVLAVGVGLVIYHGWSLGGTVEGGVPPPRFSLPGYGVPVLWILIAGAVFLAFDIRVRDQRERVAEVLDARPVSNIVLLVGRWLAIAFAAWLPLALLAVVIQVGGLVVEYLDLPAGVPAEPVSLVTFVLLDAPTALLLWSAVVILLTAVLRFRLAVGVVALALLGIYSWALFATPLYLLPVVSGIANLGLLGSEIVPRTASVVDLLQRASILVLGVGMLCIAAVVLQRRDANARSSGLVYGATLLVAAVGGLGALGWSVIDQRHERLAWRQAHEELLDEPRVDIERLSGTVSIDPGRELVIDVDLEVSATEAVADVLHFSLNPGLAVDAVRYNGAEVEYTHALGLVNVVPPKPLAAGARAKLSIRARGVPDPRFAYLDSADWAMDEPLLGKPLVLRGDQASLFDADFVALTPAVAWLPLSGPNIALDDPGRRSPDFHEIDLLVTVPEGWRAAGPGRRADDGGLRFRPRVAVAEFPLIAAPFERLALTEGDAEFELLLHPAHMANVEFFSRHATSTVQFIRQGLLQFLAAPGPMAYPHDVLSLVEVPAQLRRYGSGQVMDTIQALPGVQLLAEHGFPTARYSARPRFAQFTDEEWLEYLMFDAEAAGPLRVPAIGGATDNLLPFLSSARGEGALAANYLLETLTASWARVRRQVAPGHWLRIGPGPVLPPPLRVLSRLLGTGTFTFGWSQFFPITLEEHSAKFSFIGVDAAASEQGVDILVHKGILIALAVERLMGHRKVGEFLALMRDRYGGGTFTVDDFIAAMTEVDPTVGAYVGHTMREVALPGFLVSDLRVFRLPDDANGAPRYQVAVNVRNDEPAPGLAGLYLNAPSLRFWQWGEFVHVPGNTSLELGVVTPGPPEEVRLETYLSKNARISRLPVPAADPETIVPAEPLNGARPSDWRPPDLGIVVDDLDPGFSFVSPPEEGFWPSPPSTGSGDGEVPEFYFGASINAWHRHGDPLTLSWGKYRRTLMRIGTGEGNGTATFAADLPVAGNWRIFYHLPGTSASGRSPPPIDGVVFPVWDRFGTYDFELVAGDVRQAVEFDARTAISGWNDIGTFELPAGPVSLGVSDSTDGNVVVADAVRWQMVGDP